MACGATAVHRRFAWETAALVVVMLVLGAAITVLAIASAGG